MSNTIDLQLPRPQLWQHNNTIAGPSYESFKARFGNVYPEPHFLESHLGTTALYELAPPTKTSNARPVVLIHGVNTPAIGMLVLARELQKLDPDAHIVLYDLWGHGLSSTPVVAHTPQIFHFQLFQVLSYMQWTRAHLVGFSFGGSTAITFAINNPWAALSVAVVAPGGILRTESFGERMMGLLSNESGSDEKAMDAVMSFLEGGDLVVPSDWQERVKNGEVVAEALREWELQNHPGYRHSVLSIFRHGGVYGFEEYFRRFAKLHLKNIAVVGEIDGVCNDQQLIDLGFGDVQVVEKADHGFVRTEADQIANIVHRFWTQR